MKTLTAGMMIVAFLIGSKVDDYIASIKQSKDCVHQTTSKL